MPAAPDDSERHRRPKVEIAVDPKLHDGPSQISAAWMAYGIALAGEWAKAKDRSDAGVTIRSDDYRFEVAARRAMAQIWKELRAAGGPPDRYLDKLAEVSDAGFIAEYVAALIARPGWTISGPELALLNLVRFEEWRREHLVDHKVSTLARFRASGVDDPPPPGNGIPAPPTILPDKVPCPQSADLVAAALRAWAEEERGIAAYPLSVSSREGLVAGLEWAANNARARNAGVVLASPKVALLFFVGGFCAVDRGAPTDAEPLLRQAVAVNPVDVGAHVELVQTLVLLRKLDAADAELDAAMTMSASTCQTALLWRKRGYILLERGKLIDSYAAYAKSLEFDPESDIAHREMTLVVQELHRVGGFDDRSLKGYAPPPPSGKIRVTRCR